MVQYIDKADVVAEIERIKKEECPTDTYEGRCKMLWFEQFFSFLDTLEVKEIDLPSNVDEAAESAAAVEFYVSPQWRKAGESLFKAGVEWMAGQGVTIEKNVGQIGGIINNHTVYHNGFEVSEIDAPILNSKEVGYGDKVIVQVRRKGE